MNCAYAYNHAAERNLLLILFLLRTALAPYWQSLVHLNSACVYYNTLLLHKIEKIKMTGTSREILSEMGDSHGSFDLFRLDSSVRINIVLVCAPKSHKIEYVPMYTIRVITRRLKCSQDWSRLGFVSALSRLCLDYT